MMILINIGVTIIELSLFPEKEIFFEYNLYEKKNILKYSCRRLDIKVAYLSRKFRKIISYNLQEFSWL